MAVPPHPECLDFNAWGLRDPRGRGLTNNKEERGMEIIVKKGTSGLWYAEIWGPDGLVYFNSAFPSYARAELDAKARLLELERIAATGA